MPRSSRSDFRRLGESFRGWPSVHRCLFVFCARKIDGDSWFTWWFNRIYQGNPSISPERTPVARQLHFERFELLPVDPFAVTKKTTGERPKGKSLVAHTGNWDSCGNPRPFLFRLVTAEQVTMGQNPNRLAPSEHPNPLQPLKQVLKNGW